MAKLLKFICFTYCAVAFASEFPHHSKQESKGKRRVEIDLTNDVSQVFNKYLEKETTLQKQYIEMLEKLRDNCDKEFEEREIALTKRLDVDMSDPEAALEEMAKVELELEALRKEKVQRIKIAEREIDQAIQNVREKSVKEFDGQVEAIFKPFTNWQTKEEKTE